MKRRILVTDGQPALGLIEEAFGLLRQLSWSAWLWYLAGMLPLVVGTLYFWSDLSTSPFAEDHLVSSAAWMLVLFLLAKGAQIKLTDTLGCLTRGQAPKPWSLRRILTAATLTLAFQPLGLFLIPVAVVITLPAAWVIAFYQSLVVVAGEPDASLRTAVQRVYAFTKLWPVQNHTILAVLTLLGVVVFINLLALSFLLPQAVKMLFGFESAMTRSPWSLLNSTVLASLAGLTGLLLDPLIKAVYVLRCFYGASTQSGEDLLVALRSIGARPAVWLVGLLAMGLWGGAGLRVQGAEASPPPAEILINPQALDSAIQATLAQREYLWRLPRDLEKDLDHKVTKPEGFWSELWSAIDKGIQRLFDGLRSAFDKMDAALKKLFGSKPAPANSPKVVFDWLAPLPLLGLLLTGAILAVGGVLAWRVWQQRLRSAVPAHSTTAGAGSVDLTDERVNASQLPQEGWLALAHELSSRGELRLAMRAFYLATLAGLAQRNLILLAEFKSNRDYLRDLARRAHVVPETYRGFADHVAGFERVWYGDHPVTAEVLEHFARQTEIIKEAQS